MPILRLLLPLAIVVGLVIFAVSNGTPVVPLVLLGTPTPPLPLTVWVLGAIAAGAGTTLAVTTLARVPAGGSRPRRSRGYGDAGYAQANQRPPYRPANAQRFEDEDEDDWRIEELGDDLSPRDSPPGMRSPDMGDRRVSEPIDDQTFDEEEYEDDRDGDEYIEEEQRESDRPRAERSPFRFPFGSSKEPVSSEVRPVWSDDSEQSRRQPTRRSPLEDWDAFSTPRQSWEDWQPQQGSAEEENRNRGKRKVRDREDSPVVSSTREASRQNSVSDSSERRNRGDETVLQDWGRGFPSDWQEYERRLAYDPDEDRDQNADAYQDDEEYIESDPVGYGSRDDEGDRYDDDEYDEYEDAYDRYAPAEIEDDNAPGDSSRDYPRNYPSDYADVDYAPDDDRRAYYPRDDYPREDYSPEDYSRQEVAASDYNPDYDQIDGEGYEVEGYEAYEQPYADQPEDAPYESPYSELYDEGDMGYAPASQSPNADLEDADSGTYVDYVRYNEDDDYYDDFEEYSSPVQASDQKSSERRSRPSVHSSEAESSPDSTTSTENVSLDESLLDLDDLENWDDFDESDSRTDDSPRDPSSDSQSSPPQEAESPRRIVEVPQQPQTMTRQGTIYSYTYRNPKGSGVGQSESVFEAKAANDFSEGDSEEETPETNRTDE